MHSYLLYNNDAWTIIDLKWRVAKSHWVKSENCGHHCRYKCVLWACDLKWLCAAVQWGRHLTITVMGAECITLLLYDCKHRSSILKIYTFIRSTADNMSWPLALFFFVSTPTSHFSCPTSPVNHLFIFFFHWTLNKRLHDAILWCTGGLYKLRRHVISRCLSWNRVSSWNWYLFGLFRTAGQ